MKVINIFLIISIFAFFDAAHAMDDEYVLDFSQRDEGFIKGLYRKQIVPDYECKILRLRNITPEKFELFLGLLEKLERKKAIKKIIYSYDESLKEMPMSVDDRMHAISFRKRIVIEKEGIMQWPGERAPELARTNNKAATFYQDNRAEQKKHEAMNFSFRYVSKERRNQKRAEKIDSQGAWSTAFEEGYYDDHIDEI